MLFDLDELEGKEPIRAQVCIVGGGLAGITLATRLTRLGVGVAVLEAGGRSPEERSQQIYENAKMARKRHRGTTEGRFRVLGGATTRWGGQLLPYTPEIMQPEAGMKTESWPVALDEIEPHYPQAEALLQADPLPYEAKPLYEALGRKLPAALVSDRLSGLRPRFSKCAPFSRRNVGVTLGADLEVAPSAAIYLHANLKELKLSVDGQRIESVVAQNYAGKEFRFVADQFVVACGTIETSRLLLASRSVDPRGVGNKNDQVGRYFHDHISVPVATLHGKAQDAFLKSFGPFIVNRTAHTMKFEASPRLRKDLDVLSVMAHVIIDEPEGSPIDLMRSFLRTAQRRDIEQVLSQQLAKVLPACFDIARMGYVIAREKRRPASKAAVVNLCIDSEQLPLASTRVRLSDEVDAFRMPKAIVDWDVSAEDLSTIRRFGKYLRENFAPLLPEGFRWNEEIFDETREVNNITDTLHPMGGCRMGTDPRTSVVDAELRVHGIRNLSIASAAVYPSGGSSNPSFTIMALTLRLAERLSADVWRDHRPVLLTQDAGEAALAQRA